MLFLRIWRHINEAVKGGESWYAAWQAIRQELRERWPDLVPYIGTALFAVWAWITDAAALWIALLALATFVVLYIGRVAAEFRTSLSLRQQKMTRQSVVGDHQTYNTEMLEGTEPESDFDEEAFDELTVFATDYAIPLALAQIDLQEALMKANVVHELPSDFITQAITRSDAARMFYESYTVLASAFGTSPMGSVPFKVLKTHILNMAKSYESFSKQADELSVSAGLDYRTHPELVPFWKEVVRCHDALVEKYHTLKRDPRFKPELFRPGINGPWTKAIR